MFFSPFSIEITSLGEVRANLSAFRTFVRFVPVLDLSVSSSSWGLGRAAVCDCGTPWTFLLPFLVMYCRLLLYSVCIGPTACLHRYLLPIIAGTNTAFYLMVLLPIQLYEYH